MFTKSKIYARFVKIKNISAQDRQQMFSVFEKYYSGTDFETFEKDMQKKTGVILVRRREDKAIVGFTTVTEYYFIMPNGKPACGVFSGDTIIQKEYWGSRVLQSRFFIYVLTKKIFSGRIPLYWLLISKGFKTYLLLANNFTDYHPHPKGKNANLSSVVENYCDRLFPGVYNKETQLLDFGNEYQMLKGGVAEISDELKAEKPKVAFFEEKNPTWQRGTELPCVGVLSYKVLFSYVFILSRKIWASLEIDKVSKKLFFVKVAKN